MAQQFGNIQPWRRIAPLFLGFDGLLAFAVFMLLCAGMLIMYSSGYEHGTRFMDHGRNMLIAGGAAVCYRHHPAGGGGNFWGQ
jgi:rod shape determining protein RodA